MDPQKTQLIEKIKSATNILVTVSSSPTVDQLAACIGLTLMLDEIGKRATAVYSGETPSTIEFLKPEETIEKDANSLRDFIIALDKSKADKLRYKVEDEVVRIFITPYKTALSEQDFDFSQGEVNVDLVIALGVKGQGELDQAITAHGRILHDATVSTINNTPDGDLGSINWFDASASSLSEQVASLATSFDQYKLDEQVATALLTGIVAETERFSNAKTSANTMTISASLISAGANQQLVASELDKPEPVEEPAAPEPVKPDVPAETATPEPVAQDQSAMASDGGSLILHHESNEEPEPEAKPAAEIQIDEEGRFRASDSLPSIGPVRATDGDSDHDGAADLLTKAAPTEPQFVPGTPTEPAEPQIDPLSQSTLAHEPLLSHDGPPLTPPDAPILSENTADQGKDTETLADIEAEVSAEESKQGTGPMPTPAPSQTLPVGLPTVQPPVEAAPGLTPADQPMDMPLPSVVPPTMPPRIDDQGMNPNSPPPVPPPMMPLAPQ